MLGRSLLKVESDDRCLIFLYSELRDLNVRNRIDLNIMFFKTNSSEKRFEKLVLNLSFALNSELRDLNVRNRIDLNIMFFKTNISEKRFEKSY